MLFLSRAAAAFGLLLMTAMPESAQAAKPARPARPAPPPLSEFDRDQQMNPAQLINRWREPVDKAARRFGVPVAWINAVMRMESGGRTMLSQNQRMISAKGAVGIMQVLPQTYQEMRLQYKLGADPFDPGDNIRAGAAYLKWLKGKYGYPALFAAYNAGPGQVEDLTAQGKPLPAETRAYLAGISRILNGPAVTSVKLTRPDGSSVLIDPLAVRSVREAFPGEYAPGVKSVIDLGVLKQGVVEDTPTVNAAIKTPGW